MALSKQTDEAKIRIAQVFAVVWPVIKLNSRRVLGEVWQPGWVSEQVTRDESVGHQWEGVVDQASVLRDKDSLGKLSLKKELGSKSHLTRNF